MKQTLSVIIPLALLVALILNQALPADAAKKPAKKKGVAEEIITDYTAKVNALTQKVYERELYTPEDSKMLVTLKLEFDQHMDNLPEATFAPLYFKLGNIYRMRGNEKDAIVCYQTILENFYDTAYGPKAKDILTQMGVEIKVPTAAESEDDFEEEI